MHRRVSFQIQTSTFYKKCIKLLQLSWKTSFFIRWKKQRFSAGSESTQSKLNHFFNKIRGQTMVFNDTIFTVSLHFRLFTWMCDIMNAHKMNLTIEWMEKNINTQTVRHNCVQFIASCNMNSKQSVCVQSFSCLTLFMSKSIYCSFHWQSIVGNCALPRPHLSRSIAILFAWATTVISAMRHAPLYLIDDYLFIVGFYQYIANYMHTNTPAHKKYPYLDSVHIILQFCRVKCGHTTVRASVCILRVISFSSFLNNLNTA